MEEKKETFTLFVCMYSDFINVLYDLKKKNPIQSDDDYELFVTVQDMLSCSTKTAKTPLPPPSNSLSFKQPTQPLHLLQNKYKDKITKKKNREARGLPLSFLWLVSLIILKLYFCSF